MTIEIKLPALGENVDSGDVVTILVAVGDTIEADQTILEIETDKAVAEVPASVGGVVKEILVKEGDNIAAGQPILILDADSDSAGKSEPVSEAVSAPPPSKPAPAPQEPAVAETPATSPTASSAGLPTDVLLKLPALGENVASGDVVTVLVSVGDTVSVDQPVVEIETDKAVAEVPATVGGMVKEILIGAGDTVAPGQSLMTITASVAALPKAAPKAKVAAPPPPSVAPVAPPEAKTENGKEKKQTVSSPPSAPLPAKKPPHLVPAAPSVRRIAREIGIDISEVPGTGPGGRISMQNVKDFSRKRNLELTAQTQPPAAALAQVTQIVTAPPQKPLPDFGKWGAVEREKLSNVRRVTAEHLSNSWGAPHVTQFDKADITELEQLRKKYAPKAQTAGGKLTITAILLKFLVGALKAFPQFNASIDMAGKEVIYKKYYHIGIAVDTPRGLLVPVIRDVDQKSIIDLAAELTQISERARDRKITLEELQGGSFTVTNLGGIGGTSFTPIVNAPEVAILGVSRGGFEPVFNKETGRFDPRLMLPLSLSYDHRLIDGADGARFIRWLVEALQNPFLLVLEG